MDFIKQLIRIKTNAESLKKWQAGKAGADSVNTQLT